MSTNNSLHKIQEAISLLTEAYGLIDMNEMFFENTKKKQKIKDRKRKIEKTIKNIILSINETEEGVILDVWSTDEKVNDQNNGPITSMRIMFSDAEMDSLDEEPIAITDSEKETIK